MGGKTSAAYLRDWRLKNPGKNAQYVKSYTAKNPDRVRAMQADWAERNIDKVRKARRESEARRMLNPKVRLGKAICAAIHAHITKGSKARRRWESLVGYTVDDLKRHLERGFLKGMSWDNYGQWHIDHIIPLSAFNFRTPDDPDFKICWALSNLRPLWAPDNTSKCDKRLHLI